MIRVGTWYSRHMGECAIVLLIYMTTTHTSRRSDLPHSLKSMRLCLCAVYQLPAGLLDYDIPICASCSTGQEFINTTSGVDRRHGGGTWSSAAGEVSTAVWRRPRHTIAACADVGALSVISSLHLRTALPSETGGSQCYVREQASVTGIVLRIVGPRRSVRRLVRSSCGGSTTFQSTNTA